MSNSNQRPQAHDVLIDVYRDGLWIRHSILLKSTSVAWGAASCQQLNNVLLQPSWDNVARQTFKVYTFGTQRANFKEGYSDNDRFVEANFHSLCILGFEALQRYVCGEIRTMKSPPKSTAGGLQKAKLPSDWACPAVPPNTLASSIVERLRQLVSGTLEEYENQCAAEQAPQSSVSNPPSSSNLASQGRATVLDGLEHSFRRLDFNTRSSGIHSNPRSSSPARPTIRLEWRPFSEEEFLLALSQSVDLSAVAPAHLWTHPGYRRIEAPGGNIHLTQDKQYVNWTMIALTGFNAARELVYAAIPGCGPQNPDMFKDKQPEFNRQLYEIRKRVWDQCRRSASKWGYKYK